jgi:hypothetical protein
MICPGCAEATRLSAPKNQNSAFMRALIFGIGAAIAGLILYAAFTVITGIEIGYLSLAVGYMVAKAMMYGSKGIGGRHYQIAAVLLTYAAVSMATIPIGIYEMSKERSARQHLQQEQQQLESQSGDQESAPEVQPPPRTDLIHALVSLALLGLVSPFLELQDPFHGIIGIVILLVGIRIAWRLTAGRRMELMGPFEVSSPAPL